MGKEKGAIAVASEKTGKSEQVVRNFIKKHPELGIVKNSSNRVVITDEQMAALCKAIEENDADKERAKAEREAKRAEEEAEKALRKAERERLRAERDEAKRLSHLEQLQWNELYEYIQDNVMCYSTETLSTNMVLRLKGMARGTYMANNKNRGKGKYTPKVILNAFKYSMPDIRRALAKNSFKDDNHKFNYVMRIVDNNLNTVSRRMKSAEASKKKTETVDMSVMTHSGAGYRRKTEDALPELEDLW